MTGENGYPETPDWQLPARDSDDMLQSLQQIASLMSSTPYEAAEDHLIRGEN